MLMTHQQSSELAKPGVGSLSGKGLARHLSCGSVRFQPLPIRTAREVFPQAAHPVSFGERVMRRVERMAATFAQMSLPPVRDGESSPSTAREPGRDIRYSIAASR